MFMSLRALTIDIGTGTQDVLLYESDKNIRNCLKMILPSPTVVVSNKIGELTAKGKNLFLTGYTMGGGPSTFAVRKHIESGLRVVSLREPALTINDDLEKVRKMGVEVVEDFNPDSSFEEVFMRDVFLSEFESMFSSLGISLPDKIFVSVQDHGFSPRMSNRKFRFSIFEKTLRKGNLFSFFYSEKEVPDFFNRMVSVLDSIKDFSRERGLKMECYVIDTVFSALIGAMESVEDFPAFVVNFGNSHTIGAVVNEHGEVLSLFEHHTSIMRRKGEKGIEKFLNEFLKGNVSGEDVFDDGGHGAFIGEVVEVKDLVATGPNSHLCRYRIANPAGDTMITGNMGMIYAYRRKFELAGV
jgi:uncharacterized protein (DUF1786 family)